MDVQCANCSAKFQVTRDQVFMTCPFCDSTLYLDRARTFRHFVYPPEVPAARVPILLEEALRRGERPVMPVEGVEKQLLPFWGVKEGGPPRPVPAFSPVPPVLKSYTFPTSETNLDNPDAAKEFNRVPCAEAASAHWDNENSRPEAFSLYMSPFYKARYGAGASQYAAWIDAVGGRVYLEDPPPPITGAISKRSFWLLTGLFVAFFLEGLLVPHFGWGLLGAVVVVGATYPFLKNIFTGGRA
ncbi:MAG: hypothetical protein P8Z49_07905 [Acidobacteriota bacterium]|jgi:hypothetical protein